MRVYISFIYVVYEWCMRIRMQMHFCRHNFLILLMLTFLYQIFSTGLFGVSKNFKFVIRRFNCLIYEKTNFLTLNILPNQYGIAKITKFKHYTLSFA